MAPSSAGSEAAVGDLHFGRKKQVAPASTGFFFGVLLHTPSSLLLPLASTHSGFGVLGHLIFSLGFPKSTAAAHLACLTAYTSLLVAHVSEVWSGLKQLHGLVLIFELDLPCISAHSYLSQRVLAPGSHSRTPLHGWSLLPASVFMNNPSRLLSAQLTWLLCSPVLAPDPQKSASEMKM